MDVLNFGQLRLDDNYPELIFAVDGEKDTILEILGWKPSDLIEAIGWCIKKMATIKKLPYPQFQDEMIKLLKTEEKMQKLLLHGIFKMVLSPEFSDMATMRSLLFLYLENELMAFEGKSNTEVIKMVTNCILSRISNFWMFSFCHHFMFYYVRLQNQLIMQYAQTVKNSGKGIKVASNMEVSKFSKKFN